ncbi:MAG: hypothetical protein ACK52J_02255 [bacterium]
MIFWFVNTTPFGAPVVPDVNDNVKTSDPLLSLNFNYFYIPFYITSFH